MFSSRFFAPVVLFVIIAGLVYGCAHNPYAATNKSYRKQAKALSKIIRARPQLLALDSVPTLKWWAGTTNFSLRKPNFVIIHHTAQNSCSQTVRSFTMPVSKVSAHYVICKDGTIHHMLNDYLRAWHAGLSRWGNMMDVNSSSIGIEIDNNGFEPFTDAQVTGLLHLLDTLKKAYSIPAANFIGHADIAPGRKVDPNAAFPWQTLSLHGFGLWYDDTTAIQPPAGFNAIEALRIVGYDVRDSIKAIQSFKLHFIQTDTVKALTEADRKVLYCLYKKYL